MFFACFLSVVWHQYYLFVTHPTNLVFEWNDISVEHSYYFCMAASAVESATTDGMISAMIMGPLIAIFDPVDITKVATIVSLVFEQVFEKFIQFENNQMANLNKTFVYDSMLYNTTFDQTHNIMSNTL